MCVKCHSKFLWRQDQEVKINVTVRARGMLRVQTKALCAEGIHDSYEPE